MLSSFRTSKKTLVAIILTSAIAGQALADDGISWWDMLIPGRARKIKNQSRHRDLINLFDRGASPIRSMDEAKTVLRSGQGTWKCWFYTVNDFVGGIGSLHVNDNYQIYRTFFPGDLTGMFVKAEPGGKDGNELEQVISTIPEPVFSTSNGIMLRYGKEFGESSSNWFSGNGNASSNTEKHTQFIIREELKVVKNGNNATQLIGAVYLMGEVQTNSSSFYSSRDLVYIGGGTNRQPYAQALIAMESCRASDFRADGPAF